MFHFPLLLNIGIFYWQNTTINFKFYISFSTILSLVKNGRTNISDFIDFVDKSMLKSELERLFLMKNK